MCHDYKLMFAAVAGLLLGACAAAYGTDVLCIYYPEWHVYPEGEAIFGKGRTEWDYVDTAKPRFPGHEQPLELLDGHPDDANPVDVAKEIDYAADAGIDAFVYDWYWADGHPIQHEALERGFLKASNRKRLKFALMWANHNRSDAFRTVPGRLNDRFWWRLKYDREEFLAAIDYCIAHYFNQPEYYRKGGKVFLSIYSARELVKGLGGPEKAKEVFAAAQAKMKAAGLPPLHLSAMVRDGGAARAMAEAGFESTSAYNITPYDFDDSQVKVETGEMRQLFTHEEFAALHKTFNAKVAKDSPVPFIPVVARGWDPSPRCRPDEPFPWRLLCYPYLGIIRNLSPDCFAQSVMLAKRQAESDPKKPGAILINAWNEYTEGSYLMPDKKNGDAYLKALRRVLADKTSLTDACEALSPLHTLWYDEPAEDSPVGWERRSLPLGCGSFGVSVFGGLQRERLQVTHESVHIRQNLTDALEIYLDFGHEGVSDYRRGLDLETAEAWVRYTLDGVEYERRMFTSYPDRVLAVRLTASRKGALDFRVQAEAPFLRRFGIKSGDPDADSRNGPAVCTFGKKDEWVGNGRRADFSVSSDTIDVNQELEYYGILFASRLCVVTDGTTVSDGSGIRVKGASEATVWFSCDTNYRLSPETFALSTDEIVRYGKPGLYRNAARPLPRESPMPRVAARVEKAVREGWTAVRARHENDVARLMGASGLDLSADDVDRTLPTDELLAAYAKGRPSALLEETYWQYGRYLLVASSRPGTLPANLQGVWNCHERPSWGSSYFHDINVQMNYWPAFSTGLTECFQAYADFNEAYRPVTAPLCRRYVHKHAPENLPKQGERPPDWWCIGYLAHPYVICGGPGDMTGPGTGGLTTKMFADWWDFTRDENVLRRSFPVVGGMAEFFVRCLRRQDDKWLVTYSTSPEQFVQDVDWRGNADTDGEPPYFVTRGTAFDQQMVFENNRDYLRLAEALGTNDALVARVRTQLGAYEPIIIGASGQIKEFREENAYGEIGEARHRHISQLVALYPGSQITKETPRELAAARRTLELRGDDSTGWALAHRLNAWARVGDGEHAYGLLRNLLGRRTYPNLWDAHPPFQIDGNFGGTAGITEMLLQSHAGYVDLLPALPKAWANGSFRDLRARGAFSVSCAWKAGHPVSVRVRSLKGQVPEIRFAGRRVSLVEVQGEWVLSTRMQKVAEDSSVSP